MSKLSFRDLFLGVDKAESGVIEEVLTYLDFQLLLLCFILLGRSRGEIVRLC